MLDELRAVLRRGEPGNSQADRALPVQLHRVGSLWAIRLHSGVTTSNRKSLEGSDGQRVPTLLLPGVMVGCGHLTF